jgi:hypothetical protein
LHGWSGLDGLHGMLADVDGLRGVGFYLEGLVSSIFLEIKKKGSPSFFFSLV